MQGNLSLAAIILAQSGLPLLEDEEAANAIDLAERILARGYSPLQLLKDIAEAGPNGSRTKALRKFNPYHAADGRFTSADDATGARVTQIGASYTAPEHKSPQEVRLKISDIAQQHLRGNPGLWRDTVTRGNFGPDKNKCNLFVYETVAAAGAEPCHYCHRGGALRIHPRCVPHPL
jgi:hypothetical protein